MLGRFHKVFAPKTKLFFQPLRPSTYVSRDTYLEQSEKLPQNQSVYDDKHLEKTEVDTRIMWVLHKFKLFDLQKFDWYMSFEQLGIDSLESTAIITSIEHEFSTIFEDKVFDNFDNFHQVRLKLYSDGAAQ